MGEIINVKKNKPSIIVREAETVITPDLTFLDKERFQQQAVIALEDGLLSLGIVIPRNRIKELSSTFIRIGKAYYSLAAAKPLF